MPGFFQNYQYECIVIRKDTTKRLTDAKKFGFKPATELGEGERVFGKIGEYTKEARRARGDFYLSIIKVLALNGINYDTLRFSESLIIAEDIICDNMRQSIFQLLVYIEYDPEMRVKKYVYDESEEPEKIDITWNEQIKFDAKHMQYSIGLYDMYKYLNEQYEKERKANKRKNK